MLYVFIIIGVFILFILDLFCVDLDGIIFMLLVYSVVNRIIIIITGVCIGKIKL